MITVLCDLCGDSFDVDEDEFTADEFECLCDECREDMKIYEN